MFAEYPDVIDVHTMAKMLGISKRLAYYMIEQNLVHYRRIGRIYRIPKASVIDFMTK